MSIPVLVVLILNLLLAIFLLYGFLWGIGRGLKKSAIRFAYFIGFVIIAAIAAPFVSSALAGIYIAPLNGSVEDFIVTQILTVPEIADLYNSSVSMQELILKLPVLIINIVVFVVLVYVSRILSWIGYLITTKIHLKKPKPVGKFGDKMYTVKEGQPVVLTEVKEKKYRWWGGLIGAVQGLVLLFLTLLPITGIVGMASGYINQTVSAETNAVYAEVVEPEYTELAKLLRENLPEDAIQVIDAYSSSIITKIFSVGEFDLKCFDSLTTITLDGERVTLRNEIKSVGEVVENVIYVMNFAEEMQNTETEQSWEDLDFNKMKRAVESMFDSGLVRSVGMDALMYYLDYATDGNPFELPDEAIQMLEAIQTSLEGDLDAETADVLKSDILALLGVAQAVFESGIIDLVQADTEPTASQILACLKGTDAENEYKVVYDFFDSLFTSKTLKAALCEGINIGTSQLAQMITDQITEEDGVAPSEAIVFSQIQPTYVSWTNVKNEIVSSIIKGIEIYEVVKDVDFDTADETVFLNLDYEKIVNNFATILNNLINTSILKGTATEVSILDELFANLNEINSIGTYLDLTKLSDIDFVSEFAPIVDIIDLAKPYVLGTATDYSAMNYTTVSTTIQTLLNSDFLEAIKTTVLDKVLEEGIEGEMAGTVQSIIENIQSDYANMSEASAELMNFVNIACVFGESGAFDLVNDDSQENINAVINNLITTKSGQTETQIARAIGYLFNSETTRILFVDLVNEFVLPSFEEVENEIGRIDKDQDWAGWATFSTDLKAIATNLTTIYNYLGGTADFDTLLSNPTTLVSNTNFQDIMSKLGEILDKFATNEIFNYGTGETAGSIYDDLLDKLVGGDISNFISITDAKSDAYVTDFWKTELESLAPAIARMNAITIGEGEEAKTLLSMLISEEIGFDNVIVELSNADIDTIFGALLDSSLLKPKAVEFVNMINEVVIHVVDEEAIIIDVATIDTDLQAQKTQILNVVKALVTLANSAEEGGLSTPENATYVEALLTALKASSDLSGVFANAYTIVNDSIILEINTLNEDLFDIFGSTPSETLVPAGTDTSQIFGQFVTVLDALSPLESATSMADMFNNYQSSFLALLNILQTNSNTVGGIFGDAYGAIETFIINDAEELSGDIGTVLSAHPEFVVEGNYNWTAIFEAINNLG